MKTADYALQLVARAPVFMLSWGLFLLSGKKREINVIIYFIVDKNYHEVCQLTWV